MIKWIYPSTLATQKMGKIYEISISGHWITGRVWEKQKKNKYKDGNYNQKHISCLIEVSGLRAKHTPC